MLTTLLPPTDGTATVAGFDVATEGPKVRQVIGAALQEAALDPHLTGDEHMRLQTALHGLPHGQRKSRGAELIERVGLTEAADRRVGGYSGGMKRRLDLALALVHNPSVLFLDEPTTGLDPQSRSALWDEVTRLSRDDGVTVFLTTQYLEEADQLAHRVGIIDDGRIAAEGTPAELKAEIGQASVVVCPHDASRREEAARLLDSFGDRIDDGTGAIEVRLNADSGGLVGVVRAFDSAGIELSSLVLNEPTLDDVFLAKTGRHLEGAGEGEIELEGDGTPEETMAVGAGAREP
jgi:ABC-2 type transport system ATP-binding protein